METIQRKPRLFFDTTQHPSHVTFDDSKDWRRNFPWSHYGCAFWSYAEPDTIRIEIDEWRVVIWGHNLGPLFTAIEDRSLLRVRAHPESEHDQERGRDTFATSIRFVHLSALPPTGKGKPQRQLDLGIQ
ncbi:MAG: hypothetical protein ABIY47_18645 [Opitutaceae bacterium]